MIFDRRLVLEVSLSESMDSKEPSPAPNEMTLRDLLELASLEQDPQKLQQLLDEISARFARGERVFE